MQTFLSMGVGLPVLVLVFCLGAVLYLIRLIYICRKIEFKTIIPALWAFIVAVLAFAIMVGAYFLTT